MASSFTLERRTYSFPKENVLVLKRKNFDDSENQSHTGRNVALGLLGAAALGAGGFAGARRGMFGGSAQMATNKAWNRLGQRFNNEGMIKSGYEKYQQGYNKVMEKNPAKLEGQTLEGLVKEGGLARDLSHSNELKAAAKASEGAAATQSATQATQPPATIAAPTASTTATGTAASTASASADPFANLPLPNHTSAASVPPSSIVAPKQGFWKRTMDRVRGKINGAKEARQARRNAKKMSDLANAVPAQLNPVNGTFLRGTKVEQVAAPAPSIMTTPPPIPKALDPTLAAQARQGYTGGFTSFQLPRVTESVPRGGSPLDNSLVQSMRGQAGMGAPNPQYTQTWNLSAIQG